MRTLIELNGLLFLASCGMLYFVLRYRVHVHLEYTPRVSRRRHRRLPRPSKAPIAGFDEIPDWATDPKSEASWKAPVAIVKDLESAIRNLGASKTEAREMAEKAIQGGPGDFDTLLFRAIGGKK